MDKINIIYRISDKGYNKTKPDYINNFNCLNNAVSVFDISNTDKYNWIIIADNVSSDTEKMILSVIGKNNSHVLHHVHVGHGAGTFNIALNRVLMMKNEEIVYFIENDYLHLHTSSETLKDMFEMGTDYATLYNHPDKFLPPPIGNPEVDSDGGYPTKLYMFKNKMYYIVNSTTMTFAAKVSTIKKDEHIMRKWTSGNHPHDYNMFLELRDNGRVLMCPVSTESTHGETSWLASQVDWESII